MSLVSRWFPEMEDVFTMSRKVKFRLRLDTRLLSAVNRIVEQRGITVDAFVTEVLLQVLKEGAEKEASTNPLVRSAKKGALRRRKE